MPVTMQQIKDYARQIAEQFKPQRIILFGSYAYGRPTNDSDVDLLVVMPINDNPLEAAMNIRRRLPRSFPLDLIVRDPSDLRWRLDQQDCFLREVVEKGTVLHEAADR